MVKVLRINDDLHQKVKYLAEKDRRTINAMAEILLETGMGTPFTGDSPKNTPSPKNTGTKTWRDMGDVLADIRLAEARKEEELRYCQDTEYGKQITDRYEAELKPLWAEYNELRGTEA